jgi:hypothetical protein
MNNKNKGIMSTKSKPGVNERKTEYLTEESLKEAGFKGEDFQFQGAEEAEIQRCLPSKKSARNGAGKPEFIIRLNGDAADLLVVECKLDKSKHASAKNLDGNSQLTPVDYAEDGVIHYMKGLSKEFNVIGLAVSGDSLPLQITTLDFPRFCRHLALFAGLPTVL